MEWRSIRGGRGWGLPSTKHDPRYGVGDRPGGRLYSSLSRHPILARHTAVATGFASCPTARRSLVVAKETIPKPFCAAPASIGLPLDIQALPCRAGSERFASSTRSTAGRPSPRSSAACCRHRRCGRPTPQRTAARAPPPPPRPRPRSRATRWAEDCAARLTAILLPERGESRFFFSRRADARASEADERRAREADERARAAGAPLPCVDGRYDARVLEGGRARCQEAVDQVWRWHSQRHPRVHALPHAYSHTLTHTHMRHTHTYPAYTLPHARTRAPSARNTCRGMRCHE